jgi:hypothetical protein
VHYDDVPCRIFLDSSCLQTLYRYGPFIYENEPLDPDDRIHSDPQGLAKLLDLRDIMRCAQRGPFHFAVSEHTLEEVERADDPGYMRWALEMLGHWDLCLQQDGPPRPNSKALAKIDRRSFDYLGAADRVLLKDAISVDCDTFLTMENKLPKAAKHIKESLGIRVMSPVGMWSVLQPWAPLFY